MGGVSDTQAQAALASGRATDRADAQVRRALRGAWRPQCGGAAWLPCSQELVQRGGAFSGRAVAQGPARDRHRAGNPLAGPDRRADDLRARPRRSGAGVLPPQGRRGDAGQESDHALAGDAQLVGDVDPAARHRLEGRQGAPERGRGGGGGHAARWVGQARHHPADSRRAHQLGAGAH